MKYQAGGTLPRETESYVLREADHALREKLRRSEFCYVLTPRQMGKSSLMVQTASALQTEGVASAIIDLSAQGYDLTSEQWYQGLLDTLAERLNLEDEMETFCHALAHLSPLQRWQRALREVVLEHISRPVVIFLDEIDITRRLNFSPDEFFAAIRACFNARSQDPAYHRLTFCLLGVASPPDLIRDPRLTPFNIGSRIDLNDFTKEETALLRLGLGHDDGTNRLLIERIYHWTQGHPYLTQKLCQTVSEQKNILTSEGVDVCCRKLFLDPASGRTEPNLLFVSSRLAVEEDEERAALLTLYARVLFGKPVADNEAEAGISELKLSGAVKSQNERLVIRNPIYRTVFDKRWARDHMPDAELRRQRIAYRKGVFRTLLIASSILTPIILLTTLAYVQWGNVVKMTRELNNNRYVGDMLLAQNYWQSNDLTIASQMLDAHSPANDTDKDHRSSFEWRYLWGRMHQDRQTLYGHKGIVYCVACSRDKKWIATGGFDKTVRLWDAFTGQCVRILEGHTEWVSAVAFSPDSKLLATGSNDRTVRLWNVGTGREIQSPWKARTGPIGYLAFSPDGKKLHSICRGLPTKSSTVLTKQPQPEQQITHIAWQPNVEDGERPYALFPDGKTIAACGQGLSKNVWLALTNVQTGQMQNKIWLSDKEAPDRAQVSPEGDRIAIGYASGRLRLCSLNSSHKLFLQPAGSDSCHALAFSPDSRLLAAGYWDNLIRIWDTRTGKLRSILRGHTDRVNDLTFTPNGKTLVSVSSDATVKLWDVENFPEGDKDEEETLPKALRRYTQPYAFAPDSRTLFIQERGVIQCWNLDTMHSQQLSISVTRAEELSSISSDGKRIATARNDLLRVWDTETGRAIARFAPPKSAVYGLTLSALLSPKGELLISQRVYSGADYVNIENISTQTDFISAIEGDLPSQSAFSRDGRLLVISSREARRKIKTIVVWDMTRKQRTYTLPTASKDPENGFQDIPQCADFSPDGRLLVMGDWAGPLRIWDGTNGKPITHFRAHKGYVKSLSFAPDGKTLATAGKDGTVKLWNVATWREVARFKVPVPQFVRFSGDGNLLLCIGSDGVHLWHAPSFAQIEARRRREAPTP